MKVLSVGQCRPDHSAISRFVKREFDAAVEPAALPGEALEKLRRERYDLVLVNRKLDADYSEGLDVLKAIKADSELADIPVMLVSNYADAHAAAVEAGGVPGFGKADVGSDEAVARLAAYLR